MLRLLVDNGLVSALARYGPAMVISIIVWTLGRVVYNLYFHPLAKYPGPRMAAATEWWQAWLEIFKAESLSLTLLELHAKHGDIVRIGPNELHFSRPSAYHEIYTSKNKWAKNPAFYRYIVSPTESTFSTCEYDKAKKRRDITLPIFSRKSILGMQHLVQECIDSMCENIDKHISEKKSVNILRAFRCCALDAVTSLCFARNTRATSEPEFRAPIEVAMDFSLPLTPVLKHFPMVQVVMSWLPPDVLLWADARLGGFVQLRKMLDAQVEEILRDPDVLASAEHPTIYHAFLAHAPTPSVAELRDEALVYVHAGTDTSSDALAVGTLNVLGRPAVLARLRAELDTVWPRLDERPRYEALEALPYLTAVVKESLRCSHGVVHPMTRIVPRGGARISGAHIPAGTIVAESNIFVHWNADVFPEPHEFRPERWLEGKTPSGESLDNWLVPFSKGPRSCVGINLGYCEIYMTFANLFRRYDLSLDGVKPSDWKWRDCYLPHYLGPEMKVVATPRLS